MNRTRIVAMLISGALVITAGCKKDVATEPQPAANASAQSAEAPAPTGKKTHVTITATTPGSVELALPVNSNNKRIRFEELKDVKGNWEQTFGGERIRSLDNGASVTFDIVSDKPEIPFLQTADGADVTLMVDGQARQISLKGPKYDWRPEKLY
ncbi:hypothetical protein [Solilutibacter silvestris]|uniref:hypothetical protein n=1 Tax=Solilutibacter silvestris TaxID=1645665 RepID=UPI003D345C76